MALSPVAGLAGTHYYCFYIHVLVLTSTKYLNGQEPGIVFKVFCLLRLFFFLALSVPGTNRTKAGFTSLIIEIMYIFNE